MLYSLYDFGHFMAAPMRMAAEFTGAMFRHPFHPLSQSRFGHAVSAGAEMIERGTRRYEKPLWNLPFTEIDGKKTAVSLEVVLSKPFCNLLRFKRDTTRNDPKVLIVAPLSGHYATLLRGTVEAMLPNHDVYITDWMNAKMVPLAQGPFDLEDNITYVMDFLRHLGPEANVVAVCQPAVPVMCAVALLAQMNDAAQPRTMTLMGGPIDPRRAATVVTKFPESKPLSWFERTVIAHVPVYYTGAGRRVYPGFVQLSGFMSMNLERHVGEHMRLFEHLVKGDGESATMHRKFYDEYLSVMDITAEFYLQTVDRVFQRHDLPRGTFKWKNMMVDPSKITKTALLTVEGELDDISAPGQTIAAHDLCTGLKENQKQALFVKQVGHYGIFNGRRWRGEIQPAIASFIRAQAGHANENAA